MGLKLSKSTSVENHMKWTLNIFGFLPQIQIFEKYRKINCLKKVTSQRNISSTNKQTREAKRCSKNELKKEIKLPNFAMNNIVNRTSITVSLFQFPPL